MTRCIVEDATKGHRSPEKESQFESVSWEFHELSFTSPVLWDGKVLNKIMMSTLNKPICFQTEETQMGKSNFLGKKEKK